MLCARPATPEDFDGFKDLARLAGPGFTSLQVSDDRLLKKLKKSKASFAAQINEPGAQIYLLMLEDTQTGEIVGVSSIKGAVGTDGPYFNYKILRQTQSSKAVNRRFDMDMLVLVNDYSGASEVGSLFVKPEMRGTGAGRLIASARYMLIAGAPQRFSQTVISELRGHVSEQGESVFWNAVGRPFFRMDFSEADEISAQTDNEFIVDLMPSHPIYVQLLPKEAQAVIGKTHPAGIGARKYLEAEGFDYDRMIDIFDGGPSMHVKRDKLKTVRESRVLPAKIGDTGDGPALLISNDRVKDFRAVSAAAVINDDHIVIDAACAQALKIKTGGTVRVRSFK